MTEKIYGKLTVIFGGVSVFLSVGSVLGKFAEVVAQESGTPLAIPNTVKIFVIFCVVLSIAISLVSAYLDSLHRLESLHASVELLTRQLDLYKFYYFNANDERIASVAMKRAAIEYVRYVGDLRRKIELLDSVDTSGNAGIILKDWSLIAIFIRQLINTLGEPDCLAVWMGISLVTRPDGWEAQNDVVYQFDYSISHAVGERILDRVYRVYHTDEEDCTGRESIKNAINVYFQRQHYDRRSAVKLRFGKFDAALHGVQDVSFVWTNNDTSQSKRENLPDPSWSIERLRSEGWRMVLALEWVVRNNFLVDQVVIHSENEAWVGEHHRKLSLLWGNSEPIAAEELSKRSSAPSESPAQS